MKSKANLAEIVRLYGEQYKEKHKLTVEQHKALRAIELCRTGVLGKHITVCDHCGHEESHPNSCRNRHCPTCQAYKAKQWVEKRLLDLLNTSYFHVVFTLPHSLNELINHNKKLFYDLFFKAAAHTLKAFAKDERHLGAECGFYGILHTWGQQLWFHPHIHFVMPSGGFSKQDQCWIEGKHGEHYLFPAQALAIVFRGKIIDSLKQNFRSGKLLFDGDARCFDLFLDRVVSQKWVVYAKRPFQNPKHVVAYLGRYTHRVAISNGRILSIKDARVQFSYKDYRDQNRQKIQNLEAEEFLKRFLYHVLPKGFQRIRHYGFYAGALKSKRLNIIKGSILLKNRSQKLLDLAQTAIKKTASTYRECPTCNTGDMHLYYLELPGFSKIFSINSS